MNGLAVLNENGLGIRKAFSADGIVTAGHTNKFGILDICMDSLSRLRCSRLRINDKCTVEAVANLLHVIIMAVIPVGTDILVMNGEVVEMGLSRLNRILPNPRYAILTARNLQSMPVNSGRFG